jgi:hypothetical protein
MNERRKETRQFGLSETLRQGKLCWKRNKQEMKSEVKKVDPEILNYATFKNIY